MVKGVNNVILYLMQAGMLVLGIILLFFGFKVIKLLFKVIMFAVSLVFIALALFSFLVVSDFRDLRSDVMDGRVLILLEENGTIVQAVTHEDGAEDIAADEEKVARLNELGLDEMALGYERIFILRPDGDYELGEDLFENPLKIIDAYRNNEIEIYPALKTTRAIRMMPVGIIRGMYEKI